MEERIGGLQEAKVDLTAQLRNCFARITQPDDIEEIIHEALSAQAPRKEQHNLKEECLTLVVSD